MYKVLHFFTDLQDNRHAYHVGDTFPREGIDVSADRIDELSSNRNRRGLALIEKDAEIVEDNEPKKRGRKK